jgi:hypothetical protein
MTTTVTSQAELDAAIAACETHIVINSPQGVRMLLRSPDSSHVEAWGSSRVVARGSSRVVAWDSSHVVARDSSRVVAWVSSRVVARVSSHVEAWVSSRVEARDSSHVVAWGSSHVVAWDSSHVEAWGSSRVEAWDSSRVVARGSSHVEARGSSHVEASPYVAVHLHSQSVTLSGGVVIDLTTVDLTDTDTWLSYHGVSSGATTATVFKAVDAELNAGQGYRVTNYPIGQQIIAGDWIASNDCGHGLHFGITPAGARRYFNGEGTPRYLACLVEVSTLIPLGDKCKAPSCIVMYEVNEHGERL